MSGDVDVSPGQDGCPAAGTLTAVVGAAALTGGYDVGWDTGRAVVQLDRDSRARLEAEVRTLGVAAAGRPIRLVLRVKPGDRYPGDAVLGVAHLRAGSSLPLGLGAEVAATITVGGLASGHAADPFRNPFKRVIARNAPLWLDALRHWRTERLNRTLLHTLAGRRRPVAAPPDRVAGRATRPATTILISMHWLDYGGAEAFAVETARAAAEAGFAVIVTCDRGENPRLAAAIRRWATAVYLLDAFPGLMGPGDLLRGVIERHRPDLVHIQHSALAYAALPWLASRADRPYVLDTTHILEHRTGGFVADAVAASQFINRHHAVSHHLAALIRAADGVRPGKVRVGKLHDMSRSVGPAAGKWTRVDRWQIAFVGRFMQQKRPYLFIEIAARLRRQYGADAFRFEMLGSGELLPACRHLGRRRGLTGHDLAYHSGGSDVAAVLGAAHVLLIPSDNEGLTLVAYEAMRADCLVVSCDVGAQGELVLPELLVPRAPFACVERMQRLVAALRDGRLDAAALLGRQREQLARTLREPTGLEVCDYAQLLAGTLDAP